MRLLPSFKGDISPLAYMVCAPLLLLLQHLAVTIAYQAAGEPLFHDAWFWFLPLRRLAQLPGLAPAAAALAFAFSLAVAWGLALLSFRRASRAGMGYALAALTIVPAIQLGAVVLLALMPSRANIADLPPTRGVNVAHVLQGVLAGIGIIVGAVLISAVTFGAYGWGLFVMTPFMVGVVTAYVANRQNVLDVGPTITIVSAAASLGGLALLATALEGFICIILVAPLGIVVAIVGGHLGRAIALAGQRRGTPLMSIALLPAVFALEAAMPPAVPIAMREGIDIAAPPAAVWAALTSDEPIRMPPGLVSRAGLAFPIGGRLIGQGVGAERLGEFSTGTARERITAWVPGKRLAFVILSQPPAMEEMSPYRRVHAPHVSGYFVTAGTRFDIDALPGGGTRLTVHALHTLRLDPVLYWEPIARWAIHENVTRVLSDVKDKSEAPRIE